MWRNIQFFEQLLAIKGLRGGGGGGHLTSTSRENAHKIPLPLTVWEFSSKIYPVSEVSFRAFNI